jgi:hypothetical protein
MFNPNLASRPGPGQVAYIDACLLVSAASSDGAEPLVAEPASKELKERPEEHVEGKEVDTHRLLPDHRGQRDCVLSADGSTVTRSRWICTHSLRECIRTESRRFRVQSGVKSTWSWTGAYCVVATSADGQGGIIRWLLRAHGGIIGWLLRAHGKTMRCREAMMDVVKCAHKTITAGRCENDHRLPLGAQLHSHDTHPQPPTAAPLRHCLPCQRPRLYPPPPPLPFRSQSTTLPARQRRC